MGDYAGIVVGAGDAGWAAGLVSARLGKKTLMFSINLEAVAMMPCNPSIGGTGKGHLVREIDALGGEMGKNIDKTFIQSKMLNTAKGPAVHSLRAQADKNKYHVEMKRTIENTPGLDMRQGEVTDIIVENGRVCGVVTKTHTWYKAEAVILATGTFLAGRVIRENFHRSALFGGQIEGIGPRYCPSIEDKVNRFADKKRHQLFIEPEGLDTDEMYIQGMSSSLPEDVQLAFYKTIAGLENIRIVRPAYAIEYDCIDPQDLKLNLEYRAIENLFCAGQFNGSSGYEEAAAQGLMAGINAALKISGREPFILGRDEAYIGVLIDDLVTKGTNEPYRIMTSRAEYRLVLRQDNADQRLTEKSYKIGLADEETYRRYKSKKEAVEKEMIRLTEKTVSPSEVNAFLESHGTSPVNGRISFAELLKRPQITYADLKEIDDETRPELSYHEVTQLEVQIKYEGYIAKQLQQIARFKKLENRRLSEDLDYSEIEGLRLEAVQKLNQIKPESVGQASRISGVSPADINVLLVYLEKRKRGN